MKINSIDRALPLSNQPVDKIRKNQDTRDFKSVLEGMVEKSIPSQGCTAHSTPSLMGSMQIGGVQPDPRGAEFTIAQRLLDKLDRYQEMLSDPGATLKMIQPAVSQMEQQVADVEKLLGELHEGHPLTMIIREAMMCMSQEVDKFNSGYYVDDQFTPQP